jgi:1-acyl-sn-glycerol-3-phosphate acyltransferase
MIVPPSGTRNKVVYWKTGFYYIAHGAGVPICLGFMDYGRKTGGIGPQIYATGNIDADMKKIRKFYVDINGKYPEKQSPM